MIIEVKTLPRKNEGLSRNSGKSPRSLVLKCDGCGDTFERKWLKKTHDSPAHFCSLRCHYSHRGGVGGYGADVIETSCLSCGKSIITRKIGGERKWGKTCSRKCYGEYRSSHPELYNQNTSAMHTEESWKKISDYVQEKTRQPGWTPNFKGEHHTEETKAHLREMKRLNPPNGEKNGMFGRKHTEQSRDKMSEVRTRKLIEGVTKYYGRNNHVCGIHRSSKTERDYWYRSSWERDTMTYLDCNLSVTMWDYECIRIPYYYENNKRWYVPDFLVEFSGGRKEIWEIKPKEFVDSRACQLKTEAAQKYCEQSAIDAYVILTRDDLKSRGIL